MQIVAQTKRHSPSTVQLSWLKRGLEQPGGKLPLFDEFGQHIDPRTVRACVEQGWAEPWYANPLKPDWQVCKLTPLGQAVATNLGRAKAQFTPKLFLVMS